MISILKLEFPMISWVHNGGFSQFTLSTYALVRREQWRIRTKKCTRGDNRWIIVGDLDDLLDHKEKLGGVYRDAWSFEVFRNFVNGIGAIDLGFMGYQFTWQNKKGGEGNVRERLDKVLVLGEW